MATFKYNIAAKNFGTAQWTWTALAVNAALVGAGYIPSPTHQTLDQVEASAVVVRDIELSNLAVTDAGWCAGDIPEQDALLSAIPIIGLLLYVKGDTDADSTLIYYSSDGVGFPFTADGFNYAVLYDQVAGGWFQA